MTERVETVEYSLKQSVAPDDDIEYFILRNKNTGFLVYFHSINGEWLMRDDVDEYHSHVARRAGKVPEDVEGVVDEQLRYISEHGEMETVNQ